MLLNKKAPAFVNKNYQQEKQMINNIENQIFTYLGLEQRYKVNQVEVNELNQQRIKTILIKSNVKTKRVFYLGHGFGGTSLMYFPLFHNLLEKGHIVLWQIRGMGLINKIQYSQLSPQNTIKFYKQGLLKVLQFYNHQQIVFISHSFGAYITLRLLLKCSYMFNIEKCILLSAIGITSKVNDYKFRCNNYIDKFHYVYSWFGWTFNITYKSLLKKLYQPLKLKLLYHFFSKFSLNQTQLTLTCKLFDVLTHIYGGSQKYFYQTFQPRVLPKNNNSIQQLLQSGSFQFQTIFYYGGKQDWVDKQGSQNLSKMNQKIKIKTLNKCGHMLPLHIKQLQQAIQIQFI